MFWDHLVIHTGTKIGSETTSATTSDGPHRWKKTNLFVNIFRIYLTECFDDKFRFFNGGARRNALQICHKLCNFIWIQKRVLPVENANGTCEDIFHQWIRTLHGAFRTSRRIFLILKNDFCSIWSRIRIVIGAFFWGHNIQYIITLIILGEESSANAKS